jgi:hypothetical protein
MIIACIGSRDLRQNELEICRQIGERMVKFGHEIITGNARGADQAFADGGNSVDRSKITLVLPWHGYEFHAVRDHNKVITLNPDVPEHKEWLRAAEETHPAWEKLSNGTRLLMARNIGIVKPSNLVVAFPLKNRFGQLGGTGQGIRYAEKLGVPVKRIDLM